MQQFKMLDISWRTWTIINTQLLADCTV